MADMNISDEFGALVLRHLDGLTDERERAALEKALASDETARAAFVWISSRHGEIREVMLPEASRTGRRRPRRSQARPRTFRWGMWAAAAACLAIVTGTLFYNLQQVEKLPQRIAEVAELASVRQTTSDVRVIRGQKTIVAVVGLKLFEGDRIEAAKSAELTFGYEDDDAKITIGGGKGEEGTKITIGDAEKEKRLSLHYGLLKAQVAPRTGGAPVEITTAHAVARVTGTSFRLIVSEADSRVRVLEGRVKFDQRATGRSVTVAANQYAIATSAADDTGLRHGDLMLGRFIIGELVFFEDFGNDASPDLFEPDPQKIRGGVAPKDMITPRPEPAPVAEHFKAVGKKQFISGARRNRKGLFWVTEDRDGKISHYAVMNATQKPGDTHVVIQPSVPRELPSFIIEYDARDMADAGTAQIGSMKFVGTARPTPVFTHPRRNELYSTPSRAGRFYHVRIEVISIADKAGKPYLDIKEHVDGTLVVHKTMYDAERRIILSCSSGWVSVDNFSIRRVEPFE